MSRFAEQFKQAQENPPPLDPVDGALLACIVEAPDQFLPLVISVLQPHHFISPDAAELWRLLVAMDKNGDPIDIPIINEMIRRRKNPHLTPGRFNAIVNSEYVESHFHNYLKIVSSRDPQAATTSELEQRFQFIAESSAVAMAEYSTMDPHHARTLLPREVWQGILREGTLAILGGESKAKKSWFSLSLSMAAVANRGFLGMAITEPQDGPRCVRVLDFELLEGNVMSRFLAMSERYEEDNDRAIWTRIKIFHHRELMTDPADWIGYAAWHCDQMKRGDLLIVDCLQALDVGENNDPGVIRRALGRLQAAATRSGVCVLVVDHFNKSTEARGKNRLSGSVAKAATPDAILLLESDGPLIKLSFELRMDPPRDPITLAFDSPSEGFRVVTEDERTERKEAGAATRRKERLSAMFPDRFRQYSKAEIAATIGKSIKTVEVWIKEMEEAITTHPQGGKNPNLYSLRNDS